MGFSKTALIVILLTITASVWAVFFSNDMARNSKVVELRIGVYDGIEQVLQLKYGDYYMWRPKVIMPEELLGREYFYTFVSDFKSFDGSAVIVEDMFGNSYSFAMDNIHIANKSVKFTYYDAPNEANPLGKVNWLAHDMEYELDKPGPVEELFAGANVFFLVWVDERPLSLMMEEIKQNGGDMNAAKITPTIHLVKQYE